MPIKFNGKNKTDQELLDEIIKLESELFDEMNEEDDQMKDIDFDAIKVVGNKLVLLNTKLNIIIDEYINSSHEEAVNDFRALVELLGMKVIFKDTYAV